jgi:Second Messenger Oligonucleotide or Dinucleotide Synthetase domain
MGGSGGGGVFSPSRTPEQLSDAIRRAEAQTSSATFEAQLSELLGELLAGYNGRDTALTQERLVDVKHHLEGAIEGTTDQLFGGSVAKHTYVDGLSDIDSLLILNDTELAEHDPVTALERMTEILAKNLRDAKVSHGSMAITVGYSDGMQLQLLPTIRTDKGLKVPSSRNAGWSHIDPQRFQEALTRRNQECAGKLVPTIKLAKAVIGILPESQRLSGYHVESLAIAAFKHYDGPKTTAVMLPIFFEHAKDLVLAPIKDRTGQSIHVDEYLGPEGSSERVSASHLLSRLAKRMRNASAAGSTAQWQALFDDPE